ncbi:hypothetical protein AC579_10459 [Pseudocercospora musae]|uniref:Uncharacterized protein n=1 Tax=Pseudocercospora musae TaxID=113226 RepID=A0A139IEB1_9PEZI|nr:hypothetical protein AC579_10459 [Pseudocercospora musae]
MAQNMNQQADPFFGPSQNHSPDWDQPNADIKTFEKVFNVVIDYDRFAAEPYSSTERRLHYTRCHRWADFWDDHTTAETIAWNFPRGSTPQDFENCVAALKARCNERTLIVFYFNGKSKGKNQNYVWKIPGIQGNVNAYNFMSSMNETTADIVWYLDCWVQTRWRPKWRRHNYMTEIIPAGPSEPDNNFNYAAIHAGDFCQGFVRMLTTYLNGPPGPRGSASTKMQSTPMIMRWDNTLSNNATRVWVNKPCKKDRWNPKKTIYRIMCDPVLVWERGRYDFFGKQIQPPPNEYEPWEPEDLGFMEPNEDEGIVADHLAGATVDGEDAMDIDTNDDETLSEADSDNGSGLFV